MAKSVQKTRRNSRSAALRAGNSGKPEVSRMADSRTDEEIEQDEDDDAILTEARDRFDYCVDWESSFQTQYVNDVKFANGDSDNGWQWPDIMRQERVLKGRPALTINKTQNHVALIVNDAKQNKAGIDIRPAGEESSYDAAQMYEGLIRNIEYASGASSIYYDSLESSVEGGIGYWRVGTQFADEKSFDQVCVIEPVEDQMAVYLDPDIKLKSGLDAMYGFIFSGMPKSEYKRQFPKRPVPTGSALNENNMRDWFRDDTVRIAEYYRVVLERDELIYIKMGEKEEYGYKSEMPKALLDRIKEIEDEEVSLDNEVKRRPVDRRRLEWFKIAGNAILERRVGKDAPRGRYVPIVRLVGKQRIIDGKLERKGIVRALKDPQRMYNYNSSGQVEYGALQTKSPWIGAAKAFQGHETQWNRANTDNAAFLTYNHFDADTQQPIPAPIRPEAPGSSPAFLQGMEIAARELEMASGQGPAQFGKPQREISGKAIAESQLQGETITYNFNDNLALAIETTGVILLDMIPLYYDTKRVIQILDKDGTEMQVQLDPSLKEPYKKDQKPDASGNLTPDQVQIYFNPMVGKYKVQARPGPAYSTQRTEAWNAFVQITTGNPEFISEFGDLMFKSADFPLADKIAERYKRKLMNTAPWLLDDTAPNQIQQQLTKQVEQATQIIKTLMEQLDDKEKKLLVEVAKISDQYRQTDIKEYGAHSERIKQVGNVVENLQDAGDTSGLQALIKQMVTEALADTTGMDKRAPIPGQPQVDEDSEEDFSDPRTPDGQNYYVKRGGQYYKVDAQGGAAQ